MTATVNSNLFDTGKSESALFRIASGVTIERADNRYE